MNAEESDFDQKQLLLVIQRLAKALRACDQGTGLLQERRDVLKIADALMAKSGLDELLFPG